MSDRKLSSIRSCQVRTGSRLHFGLLRPTPDAERAFGGAGMMIDLPPVVVRASWEGSSHSAAPEALPRLQSVWQRYLQWDQTSPAHVEKLSLSVVELPEMHTGLGTGTQLALATAAAIMDLLGKSVEPEVLALQIAGRGKRSAVGTHGFFHGGFIIDAGCQSGDPLGKLQCRVEVPEQWRVVTVTPRKLDPKVQGADEEQRFATCPLPPAQTIRALEALLSQSLLPAVQEADFDKFAQSLTIYNRDAGSLFADVQGGPYNGPAITELVDFLRGLGNLGVGQSSWGPTVFAFCADQDQAQWVADQLAARNLQASISRPLNHGAVRTVEAVG